MSIHQDCADFSVKRISNIRPEPFNLIVPVPTAPLENKLDLKISCTHVDQELKGEYLRSLASAYRRQCKMRGLELGEPYSYLMEQAAIEDLKFNQFLSSSTKEKVRIK